MSTEHPSGPSSVAVTKAVIPVAGLGTRFLPATKAVAKELLPVVDRPAIEYVVEEASSAGLDDVLLVSSRGKDAIVDHFDSAPHLEAALEAKGDEGRLEAIRRPSLMATVHAVRQDQPRGLGHAVLCAADHVGHEAFAVLLGDDLIDSRDPLLARMIQVRQKYGGSVLAFIDVPREMIQLYGCAAAEPTDEADVVTVTGLVEKPAPDEAPSTLAIIGRYVLAPEVFDALRATPPGRGGEIQLTDAIQALAAAGEPVHGVLFDGRRYDTGDKQEYLRAVVRLACDREDLGPDFRAWLREYAESLPEG